MFDIYKMDYDYFIDILESYPNLSKDDVEDVREEPHLLVDVVLDNPRFEQVGVDILEQTLGDLYDQAYILEKAYLDQEREFDVVQLLQGMYDLDIPMGAQGMVNFVQVITRNRFELFETLFYLNILYPNIRVFQNMLGELNAVSGIQMVSQVAASVNKKMREYYEDRLDTFYNYVKKHYEKTRRSPNRPSMRISPNLSKNTRLRQMYEDFSKNTNKNAREQTKRIQKLMFRLMKN